MPSAYSTTHNYSLPRLRFWDKVDKQESCWIWTGTTDVYGYGRMKIRGRVWKAHRYSWLLHNREIPKDRHVLHHCDNPLCVNPTHLFLGSNVENTADKVEKNRQAKGSEVGSAKLSEYEVQTIRKIYQRGSSVSGSRALARKYGVAHRTILDILQRKNWRHI